MSRSCCSALHGVNQFFLKNLFISSDPIICPTVDFLQLRNPDHVVVSDSIKFPSNTTRDVPFYRAAYAYYPED